MTAHAVTLSINGRAIVLEVEPSTLLLDCLRNHLDVTGPKQACDVGVCGACSVLVDGKLVKLKVD